MVVKIRRYCSTMDTKVDWLKGLVPTKDNVELSAVLDWLAEMQLKLRSTRTHGPLGLKIETSGCKPRAGMGVISLLNGVYLTRPLDSHTSPFSGSSTKNTGSSKPESFRCRKTTSG